MDFFKKKQETEDAPQAYIVMANKIMVDINGVINKHEKEIHLMAPTLADKLNFTMILTTVILDSHCNMISKIMAVKREKHLDNICVGIKKTWADKRNT